MTEPAVRSDGICAREGCDEKRKIPPKKHRYMPVEVYKAEPFCSRTCCEKHYGIYRKGGGSGSGVGRTPLGRRRRKRLAA